MRINISYFHGLLSQYWVICCGSRGIVVAHVNRRLSVDRRKLSSRRALTAVPHDLFC